MRPPTSAPGTYTMMTQLAAECSALPHDNVTAKLGDSTLPDAPVEGGSFTTASVGSRGSGRLPGRTGGALGLAQKMAGSPLMGAKLDDVVLRRRQDRRKDNDGRDVSVADAMRAGNADRIEKEASAEPKIGSKYAHFTHSAVFAEVKIDEQLGIIRVTRVVNAVAAGRILNPKTARSQVLGARGRGASAWRCTRRP